MANPQYNPKSVVMETTFCDILTRKCQFPDLNCIECDVFKRNFGR